MKNLNREKRFFWGKRKKKGTQTKNKSAQISREKKKSDQGPISVRRKRPAATGTGVYQGKNVHHTGGEQRERTSSFKPGSRKEGKGG